MLVGGSSDSGRLPVPHAVSTAQANAGSLACGRTGLPHTLACGTMQCAAGEFAETRGRVRENQLNTSTKRCFTEEMCVSATCGCRPCSSPAVSPVQGAGDLPWRERLQDGQVEISSETRRSASEIGLLLWDLRRSGLSGLRCDRRD